LGLNLVERFFGLLTEKALKRGSHASIPHLRAAILAYVDAHNEHNKPFRWTKTADETLDKMRRFASAQKLVAAPTFDWSGRACQRDPLRAVGE
jgi:hypothetical protein